MDPVIIALITLAIGIISVLFFLNKKKETNPNINEQPEQNVRNLDRPRANANHPARNRLRNRVHAQNVGLQQNEVEEEEERNLNDMDEVPISELDVQDREELRKKIGTKKLAKLEEKEEKRRRNEEMLREREEKREQEEAAYEKRKRLEREEEELERQKEEEERLAKEEEEKRE